MSTMIHQALPILSSTFFGKLPCAGSRVAEEVHRATRAFDQLPVHGSGGRSFFCWVGSWDLVAAAMIRPFWTQRTHVSSIRLDSGLNCPNPNDNFIAMLEAIATPKNCGLPQMIFCKHPHFQEVWTSENCFLSLNQVISHHQCWHML